jgi:hypothetical protein
VLELVNDSKLVQSDGHAVVFRQTFGGQAAGHDGLITVGVANGRVAYVSSTAAGSRAAPAARTRARSCTPPSSRCSRRTSGGRRARRLG